MKRFAVVLAFFVTILSASGADKTLRLFIWSEYVDPQVIKDFEAEFKCKVVMDFYEDAESMLGKLQAGGKGLYDLTVPPDYLVPAMIKLKLAGALRHERLPNLKNLEAKFLNPPYDQSNRFSVPYQWGTVGILARKQDNKTPDNSWGLIFDSSKQLKPFLLIDSMRDLMGAALKFQGASLNSADLTTLKKTRDLLQQARKNCAGFDGSVGAKNKVLSRTAKAAIVYSGEGARAVGEDSNLVYFIPREGSQIWVDNLVILAGAPNRDLVEEFINYMLDAKVGARISNFTQFTTPNAAAKPFIKPALLNNGAIYPPTEVVAKLEFLQDLGAKTRLYDEIWTQVKSSGK